mmetsp:Transcript_64771/g.189968  ORF Transcript_64771/g.189968 Transcript_64771/m.189968 type:complete len:235 (+) Transcript_64771:1228-1932(+)
MPRISIPRILVRSSNSAFLVVKAASVSSINFLSSVTCCSRASTSPWDSSLLRPRAPFSDFMSMSAVCAVSSIVPLAPLSLSYCATASASFFLASSRFWLKSPFSFFRVLTTSPDWPSYFDLKVAFRFSFFQSGFGTSPWSMSSMSFESPLVREPLPNSRAFFSPHLTLSIFALWNLRRKEVVMPASRTVMDSSIAAMAFSISSFAASKSAASWSRTCCARSISCVSVATCFSRS